MLAYSKDNEPMARVSKVARGMISLTHGVLFLLPDQRLYIVKCICVCVCVCVYETGYLSLGRRPGGDWAINLLVTDFFQILAHPVFKM